MWGIYIYIYIYIILYLYTYLDLLIHGVGLGVPLLLAPLCAVHGHVGGRPTGAGVPDDVARVGTLRDKESEWAIYIAVRRSEGGGQLGDKKDGGVSEGNMK